MEDGLEALDLLLAARWTIQIVSASSDVQVVCSIINAMGGRDNDVGRFLVRNADQGATTEVAAALLQADDPWMRVGTSLHTADDASIAEFSVGTHAG